MGTVKYRTETMNNALSLLNNLEVKGIENCKRVALIAQLIDSPEKEESKDGNLHERSEE